METPFGLLEILVTGEDGRELQANMRVIEKEIDEFFSVDGRYLIEVRLTPQAAQSYRFTIRFEPFLTITDAYVETGEHLELKSWFSGNLKWSLGAVDDEWLLATRKVNLAEVEYLDNGITLRINGIPVNEPFLLPFGAAWKKSNDPEDAATWFAASPAAMHPPKWLQPEKS